MKRLEAALLFGLVASVVLAAFTAFAGACEDIREEVLRVHILANSNTDEDQQLKIAVRDAVLQGTEHLFTVSATKGQIEETAQAHLEEIRQMALAEIYRQGYSYTAEAELVNMFFDTRVYGDVTLPAGHYDAVRITIGEGAGANWWCVMFPPMCIPAASDGDGAEVEEQISRLGEAPQYKAKFAVVELVESFRDWMSNDDQ